MKRSFLFALLFLAAFQFDCVLKAAVEVEDPVNASALFTGARPGTYTEIRSEPGSDASVAYTARPGEILRASQHNSGGFRLIDGFQGQKISAALFVPAKDFTESPSSKVPRTAHFDLAGSQLATVYSEPGHSLTDCGLDSRLCTDLPANTPLQIIDARMMQVDALGAGSAQKRWQNFYRLQIGERTGWVRSDVVLPGGPRSRPSSARNTVDCPNNPEAPSPQSLLNVNQLRDAAAQAAKEAAARIAEQLAPSMGLCLIEPPDHPPFVPEPDTPFEKFVGGYWRKHPTTTVAGPNGAIDKQQLEAIDAFARTLYGEMANCADSGSQYIAAAAAVAVNRANFIAEHANQRSIFAASDTSPGRSTLTDVLISPMQFSVWNRSQNVHEAYEEPAPVPTSHHASAKEPSRRPAAHAPSKGKSAHVPAARVKMITKFRDHSIANQNLRQVLCPASQDGQPFWAGRPATPRDRAPWNASLQIATEAVLYPEEFAKRSAGVKALYYTSGLGFFKKGFQPESGSIDGHELSNPNCIELWVNPKGVGRE
jgi:hypothetical protein